MAGELPLLSVARLARRDGGPQPYCLHCGVEEGLGVQHRGVKGMGGSNTAERASNGIILCNLFNVAIEMDAAAAEFAIAYGWKVSRWADPQTIPVYDSRTGYWWALRDDWTRVRVA